MHFQIYIPGAKDLGPELATVGLGDFVHGAEVMRCEDGPDGKGGAVFAWWGGVNAKHRQIGYRPAEQKWYPSRCGKFWSGLWNAGMPTPEECLRNGHVGRRVRLGDGKEWQVPALDNVERELVLVDGGKLGLRIPDKFDDLMLEKFRWLEWVHHNPTFTLTEDLYGQMLDTAIVALRLNYRMTREVALAAALLSTRSLVEVLNASLGHLINVPE